MEDDGANGHPASVHIPRSYNLFSACDARSRWPSLILFSLGSYTKSMPTPQSRRIFVSYSHKDRRWLEELLTHLAPFRDRIEVWADTQIDAGENWHRQITTAIRESSAAIILVSADFLASKFLQDVELPEILKAADERGLPVMPILVRPSLWQRTPLDKFQFLNPPDKPLAELSPSARDATFVQIAQRLSAMLGEPVKREAGKQEYSQLAHDIARQVSELLRAELPTSPSVQGGTSQDKKIEDSKFVFIICAFSDDMEPVVEGIKAAADKVGLTAKRVKDVLGDYQITGQVMSMRS